MYDVTMARMEFVTAVKQADAEERGEEAEVFEFAIAGVEFRAALPSAAQLSLLSIAIGDGDKSALSTALDVFDGLLENKGGAKLRRMLNNGTVSPGLLFWGDELNETGILAALVEQVAGRPTMPSSSSSSSPKSAGRKSTGRAPSKASTRSDSPSIDS